jgi:hypothetical protein
MTSCARNPATARPAPAEENYWVLVTMLLGDRLKADRLVALRGRRLQAPAALNCSPQPENGRVIATLPSLRLEEVAQVPVAGPVQGRAVGRLDAGRGGRGGHGLGDDSGPGSGARRASSLQRRRGRE